MRFEALVAWVDASLAHSDGVFGDGVVSFMHDVGNLSLAATVRLSECTLSHLLLAIESPNLFDIKLGQLLSWGDRIWHSNVARPDSKFWVVPDPVLDDANSVCAADIEPRSQVIN